jgi:hypothetical protein
LLYVSDFGSEGWGFEPSGRIDIKTMSRREHFSPGGSLVFCAQAGRIVTALAFIA